MPHDNHTCSYKAPKDLLRRILALYKKASPEVSITAAKGPIVSKETKERIVLMYQRGMSAREITEQLEISMGAVYNTLYKHQIPRKRPWRPKEFIDEVVRLRKEEGLTPPEIASILNVSLKYVHSTLDRRAIKDTSIKHVRKQLELDPRHIKELYQSGTSLPEIAEQYNVNPLKIRRIIDRLPERKLSRDLNIVNMYKKGMSPLNIAKKLGLSDTTIYAVLREQGISLPPPRTRTKEETEDRIIDLKQQGYTVPQISKNVGVSVRTIQRIFSRRGLRFKEVYSDQLTPMEQQEIARLYQEEGLSYRQIAKKLNTTTNRVMKAIKSLQIPAKSQRVPKDVEKNIIRSYRRSMKPVSQIAEEHGLHPSTVRKVLHRRNVTSRPDPNKAIVLAYQQGASIGEIAEEFGVSTRHVTKLLESQGIKV